MSNTNSKFEPGAWCDKCKEYKDSLGRCGCDYQRSPSRVNWNSGKLIAVIAATVLALSLFAPAHATGRRDGSQAPQPTPSISTPPDALYVVFLPVVAANDVVSGTVSWCPSCSPRQAVR